MSKRVILSIADLTAIMTGNEIDGAGNVILSEAGSDALIRAVSRTLRRKGGRTRKPPVDLSNPETLLEYKNRITIYMADHPDAGIVEVSKEIKLGESTVSHNPDLREWYENLLSGVSLARPSTVSNDPDYNYDNDD